MVNIFHSISNIFFVLWLTLGSCYVVNFGMERDINHHITVPDTRQSLTDKNILQHSQGNIHDTDIMDNIEYKPVVITKGKDTIKILYNKNTITLQQIQSVGICQQQIFNIFFENIVYIMPCNNMRCHYFIQYLRNNKIKVLHKYNDTEIENNAYIFALVTVRNNENTNNIVYLLYCENANTSRNDNLYIYGLFEGSEAIDIEILDCGRNITDMGYMFSCCRSLKNLNLDKLRTNNVIYMNNMFWDCSSLLSLNLSHCDTSKVIDMCSMFCSCRQLIELDLSSSFHTNKVKNMKNMLKKCSNLTKLDVSNFKTSAVEDMSNMFANCSSLTELDLENFVTSNVTNMYAMFHGCSNLKTLNLKNFNTSKVKDMRWIFGECKSLTKLDLLGFNTKNVTSMRSMFYNCRSLIELDLTSFDTRIVSNMNYMFENCRSLKELDLSSFNICSEASMSGIFFGGFNFTIKCWLICKGDFIEKIKNTQYTCLDIDNDYLWMDSYYNDKKYICFIKNKEIIEIDNYSDILYVLKNANKTRCVMKAQVYGTCKNITLLQYKILKLDNYKIVNNNFEDVVYVVRYNNQQLQEDDFDNSSHSDFIEYVRRNNKVKVISKEYGECKFNDKYILALVTVKDNNDNDCKYFVYCEDADSKQNNGRYYGLFQMSDAAEIEILSSGKEIKDMSFMFVYCGNLTKLNVAKLNTTLVYDMGYMFAFCKLLPKLSLSNFNIQNVENMNSMFSFCTNVTELDLSNFKNNKIKDTSDMFSCCEKLKHVSLCNFDTHNVIDMTSMFTHCHALKMLDLKNFDTRNVIYMNSMFAECHDLTKLNLSNFNTGKVEFMSCMFSCCSSLMNLDLSNFNTEKVIDMSFMFYGCSSLLNLDLYNFKNKKVTNMSNMFYDCGKLKSVNLKGINFHNITDISYMFHGCENLTRLDLSNFNAINITDMNYIFEGCFKDNATLLCSGNLINVIMGKNRNNSDMDIGVTISEGFKYEEYLDSKKYKCTVKNLGNNVIALEHIIAEKD